jgi:hypothetical protein
LTPSPSARERVGMRVASSSRIIRGRAMIRAHLLRWRPRSYAQRTESTPRVRLSGAASQLDPSRRPSRRFSDGLLGRRGSPGRFAPRARPTMSVQLVWSREEAGP